MGWAGLAMYHLFYACAHATSQPIPRRGEERRGEERRGEERRAEGAAIDSSEAPGQPTSSEALADGHSTSSLTHLSSSAAAETFSCSAADGRADEMPSQREAWARRNAGKTARGAWKAGRRSPSVRGPIQPPIRPTAVKQHRDKRNGRRDVKRRGQKGHHQPGEINRRRETVEMLSRGRGRGFQNRPCKRRPRLFSAAKQQPKETPYPRRVPRPSA